MFTRILTFLIVTVLGIVATNMIVGSNHDLYGLGSLCTVGSFICGFVAAAIVPIKKEMNDEETKRNS